MKRLGVTLLAVALGLPVFAAQTGSTQNPAETQQSAKTTKSARTKRAGKRHHKKSANSSTAAPTAPSN